MPLRTGSGAVTRSHVSYSVLLSVFGCCATADARRVPAALAACAARHWLARNAACVKVLRSTFTFSMDTDCFFRTVPAHMSLVSCLPALEHLEMHLNEPLGSSDLGSLLEALAWLPRLRTLMLCERPDMCENYEDYYSDSSDDEPDPPCPDISEVSKLRSLTKLSLSWSKEGDTYTIAGVVDALVTLTGLVELNLGLPYSAVVPAALGRLKGLRSLVLAYIRPCVPVAGCFELPNLASLEFVNCFFKGSTVLPGVTALQSLTSIMFSRGCGPRFFNHQLVHLPKLQRIVHDSWSPDGAACLWLSRLPADMGSLSSTLLHLMCLGAGFKQFPLALTQLVALEHLETEDSDIAQLPSGITALSRLTNLVLGRGGSGDALQQCVRRPLDVRALGDLSAFPALCKLTFSNSEVLLCESMLGVVRHASLASIAFNIAHPAPKCALMVMQLSRALRRLGRGSVLSFKNYMYGMSSDAPGCIESAFQSAHALPPLHKFLVAFQAYGM